MVNRQSGDLALFNNLIAGDLFVEGGQPAMEPGLETAVFITLFSGKQSEFWANEYLENEPTTMYGGEFEPLAEGLQTTPQNALRLQQTMLRDLQWLKDEGIAKEIVVSVEIVSVNKIDFVVTIVRPDQTSQTFKFSNNWTGQELAPSHLENK